MVRFGLARRALILTTALLVIACGSSPVAPTTAPSAPTSTGAAETPAGPESSANTSPAAPDVVAGPWLASPIPLADSQVAVVSDACAAAAREKLGDAEADLPTAVVDARGAGRVVAILSDGSASVECLAHLAATGAIVDSIDRLALASFEAVEGTGVAVTELATEDDGSDQRTVAAGRVGPDARRVRITLTDGSSVEAATGATWWAAWWPGGRRATTIATLAQGGAAQTSVNAPADDVESRLAPGTWWVDPKAAPLSPDATTIDVLVRESACASGQSGLDRLDPPWVAYDDTTITVRFDIRRLPGAQDCQGNAPFPFTLELGEAVGGRTLLDGSTRPPRDATKPFGG